MRCHACRSHLRPALRFSSPDAQRFPARPSYVETEVGEFHSDLADVPGGAALVGEPEPHDPAAAAAIAHQLVQAAGAAAAAGDADPGLASLPGWQAAAEVASGAGEAVPQPAEGLQQQAPLQGEATSTPPAPMAVSNSGALMVAVPEEDDRVDAMGGTPHMRVPSRLDEERKVEFEDLRPRLGTKHRHSYFFQVSAGAGGWRDRHRMSAWRQAGGRRPPRCCAHPSR